MQNKVILLISTEPWGRSFVSKHHYAHYLSQKNTVYFLNPPKASNKHPFQSFHMTTEKITDSLIAIDYHNLIPRLNVFPLAVQRYIFKTQAKKIQKRLGVKVFDIVWSFDPSRFFEQTVWKHQKAIYHVVDFHLKATHEQLIRNSSDLQIVVSYIMKTNYKGDQSNMHRIGHGFPPPKPNQPIPQIPGNNKIKAIYVGNVNGLREPQRFCELADKNKTVDFILIGPYRSSNLSTTISSRNFEILQRPNIHLIGALPPEAITAYLKQCDINLLIMKGPGKDPKTNSHKLMEYFYSGNVVLSDHLLDYNDEPEQLITLAKSNHAFQEKFAAIVSHLSAHNSEENKAFRINYAEENSYLNKIATIEKLIYK